MGYDGLDRLTAAVGPWGDASYSYDALDNLKSADQGTRQFRYVYDATTWRLGAINTPAGAQLYSFTYDAQGNTTAKNSQAFVFDAANRMSSASTISGTAGLQSYRYDGLGRRVQTTDPGSHNPPKTFYFYTQAGQILYASEARNSINRSYIYLNGSQIATRAKTFSGTVTVRYQMTDALGSPVASTNTNGGAASIQRTSYTPWGEATPSVDGTGYTGHVMDANTGMTYMQQRYYDPAGGRFMSVDPVSADGGSGFNFNRFWYANNNPYKFTDPDGRIGLIGGAVGGAVAGFKEAIHQIEVGNVKFGEIAKPAAFAAVAVETYKGFAVGAVTAGVPGGIAAKTLDFGGKAANIGAALGTAYSAAAGGEMLAQLHTDKTSILKAPTQPE